MVKLIAATLIMAAVFITINQFNGSFDSTIFARIDSLVNAKKYRDKPDTSIDTLWFDDGTKLPVKLEFDWLGDDGPRKRVLDQFEWNPELPAETFIPEIAADFTLEENSNG